MKNTYEERNETFICFPSQNASFGYGFAAANVGFVYLKTEEDGEQDIINDIY